MGRWVALPAVAGGLLLVAVLASSSGQRSPDEARETMIERDIQGRGIDDPRVIDAIRRVPRDRFVPPELAGRAWEDNPLPIGAGQTISQPYIVAYMTELLEVAPEHRVLEIGTGSGYQAAVLGELAREVYTIEIVPMLAQQSAAVLAELGYTHVRVRAGDGYLGWPEAAPFDRIMLTAAPPAIPEPLLEQLAMGGRLVAPVGGQDETQWMTVVEKTAEGIVERQTIAVRFVPFTRGKP